MWSADKTPLWVNDGSVAVAGLATGAQNYWNSSPVSGGAFSATPVWHGPFHAEGADKLFLLWEGRIVAIGGITGNTAGNVSFMGLGLPWWTGADFIPQLVSENSTWSSADAATDVESNQSKAITLYFRSPNAVDQTRPGGNNLTHIINHNILPIGTSSVPATTDVGLWYTQIGTKPAGLSTSPDGLQDSAELKATGLHTFWLTISHNSTITGTLLTTQLKGQLSLIRVWENGTLQRA